MCWYYSQQPKDACLRKFAGVTEKGWVLDSNDGVWVSCVNLEDYIKEFM